MGTAGLDQKLSVPIAILRFDHHQYDRPFAGLLLGDAGVARLLRDGFAMTRVAVKLDFPTAIEQRQSFQRLDLGQAPRRAETIEIRVPGVLLKRIRSAEGTPEDAHRKKR